MSLQKLFQAILSLLLLSATAHADTYTLLFSATDGPTLTFNFNPDTISANPAQGFLDVTQATDGQEVEPVFLYPSLFTAMGLGAVDFEINAYAPYFNAVYNGPQLFTGDDGPPLLDGTYQLAYNSYYGAVGESGTATLTILSTTPEPASLTLLATGLIAVRFAARRRFTRA